MLLSEGHLLIEDVPGVGKTKLATALASAIDCSARRIQFTPDLLPSDVTGSGIYRQDRHEFEFKPGAVFANLVIADEINRASAKTQSALLECMEERQVTADGETYQLERPFMVIATQNPSDMDGTYLLPEAQRDRFAARVSMGYPDRDAEFAMLELHSGADPLRRVTAMASRGQIRTFVETVRRVHVSDDVKSYIIALTRATREHRELRLGASPRASLQLVKTARAIAAVSGRHFVTPDDVQALAVPVLAHRLTLTAEARLMGHTASDIVSALVDEIAIPRTAERAWTR